jgi:hypothetical protein
MMGSGYWTSTPKAGDASSGWEVQFDFKYGYDDYEDRTSGGRVRCVRWPEQGQGGVSKSHWNVQNGTVHDNFTGLTWQESVPTTGGDDGFGNYSWSDAKSHCAELALDGGGWRLPKVKELATLVDDATENPAIDSSVFPGLPKPYTTGNSGSFWSSTVVASYPATAGLLVDFEGGPIYEDGVQYPYQVRCVR